MAFERLKTIEPLLVIALDVDRLPVVLPAPICNVPALMTVAPEYVLLLVKRSVPFPSLVSPKELPEMAPPTVKVLLLMVIWREAFMATDPLPVFRAFEPAKVKSPFQFWLLLFERVIALPLVLSTVPPESVSAPEPMAVALLILRVPALRVVPPE